jgi:hypothetical protein
MIRIIATTIKSSIREKPFCSLTVCSPWKLNARPYAMREHCYITEQSPCQSPSFSPRACLGSRKFLIINILRVLSTIRLSAYRRHLRTQDR